MSMTTAIDAAIYTLQASQKWLHRMVDDLKADEWDRQVMPGTNSVSWIVGHLALTDRRQLTWLGAVELPPLPEGFEARFQTTKAAAEKQAPYGNPQEILSVFDAHRNLMIQLLPSVSEAKFAENLASPRPMFATVGEATLFMSLHVSMHIGQITMIRRALGYPPMS